MQVHALAATLLGQSWHLANYVSGRDAKASPASVPVGLAAVTTAGTVTVLMGCLELSVCGFVSVLQT